MSKTILLCEDEEFVARSYMRKLKYEGFTVHLARNGQEALDLLRVEQVDLILLDLMMQIKSGFDVLAEIQGGSNENLKKIPVIVASNLGQRSDIEEAKRLGAVDYIVKSNVSLKELVSKVREFLPQA
jgi:DNA-binding response OmpR family regulator